MATSVNPSANVIRCRRCVMDTTDPEIRFDTEGVCNHCSEYDRLTAVLIHEGDRGREELARTVERIRKDGRGRTYDCVIGLSGGVDSSYVALKVKELGLRAVAVHVDNGWDTEIAVRNIENIVRKLGIDLKTDVLDWDEFRDLQLAFLRASTPDSEIPSDHAIMASMYHAGRRMGVRHLVWGYNTKTETHLPRAWSHGHNDWRYIKSVHRMFGTRPRLNSFPHLDFVDLQRFYRSTNHLNILNYLDYTKAGAIETLEKDVGWRSYGGKHGENIYTRFYQGYILPRKFGFDKRKTHFSSAICSGHMAREEALRQLEQPPYPTEEQMRDLAYVAKKLRVSPDEFDRIMGLPPKTFWDYPSFERIRRMPAVAYVRRLRQRVMG